MPATASGQCASASAKPSPVSSSVSSSVALAPQRFRAAHVALAVVFGALGTIDGAWAARLPALKDRLGLDNGQLGVVIFSVTLAATLLLPVAGWLASRFGSRRPNSLGLLRARRPPGSASSTSPRTRTA